LYASRRTRITIALLLLLSSGTSGLQATEKSPPAGPPYRVEGKVQPPKRISGMEPVLPKLEPGVKVSGKLILEPIIDEQGNVTDVKVVQGVPMGITEAVVAAVRTWKFTPATLKGRPVPVYFTLTLNFDTAPDFGPHFAKYLEGRPKLASLLRGRRYLEATEYLDAVTREARDPELQLARAYLFLAQDRLKNAWREAKAYRGPEPYEIFHRIGAAAWTQSGREALDAKERAEMVELGLKAETQALAEREGSFEAIAYKSLLLREKAKLASDPNESRELLAEADRLRDQALELEKAGKADGALEPAAREALSGSAEGI
jgi:TonB family protein